MAFEIRTKNNFALLDVASALQKSIRRNEQKLAGWCALELFASGYANYAWKRLLTISAEDCDGIITTEIYSLFKGWQHVNEKNKRSPKGRIFLTKATIILATWWKNRDPDHLQNLVYDKNIGVKDGEIEKMISQLKDVDYVDFPDYVFDVHTQRGKMMGKTKEEFFKDELNALEPRQTGIFDDLVK